MQNFFYGWYFKCQSVSQTLALIPAVHQAGKRRTCSLQAVTDDGCLAATFPGAAFSRKGGRIVIGENHFGPDGVGLCVRTPELRVEGALYFRRLRPLKYDIMGPFAFVPFMECRHGVWSMRHEVRGRVEVNGKPFDFSRGVGYWEGDRGRSFPKEYAWTQCLFKGGSLMLSVAEIPMAKMHFTGIIGVVLWKGREYRLATYLGARVVVNRNGMLRIVQGDMVLDARMKRSGEGLAKDGARKAEWHPLKAPVGGDMTRTIHESPACGAAYRFRVGGRTLFAFETERASFEYEYGK